MSFINNEREQHFWRNWATRILLIVITVSLIVSLMPRGGQQLFHYEVGKPWMYNSFFARFDFPVYKTDETIQDERDSLMQYFQPYYSYNKDKEKQMAKFDYQITELVSSLDDDIQRVMTKVYDAGFDSFNLKVLPNGFLTMATFSFFVNEDMYSVEVDSNGVIGEVRKC